ncbi:Uncharacterised protein [Klebsiella pneumoniae]|nr:Uncharacterised protein [Klebsiella pneumoniae]
MFTKRYRSVSSLLGYIHITCSACCITNSICCLSRIVSRVSTFKRLIFILLIQWASITHMSSECRSRIIGFISCLCFPLFSLLLLLKLTLLFTVFVDLRIPELITHCI